MSIIGTLPNTISNGDPLDATPVMADFNWIVSQVNGNAAPLASPTFSGAVTINGSLTATGVVKSKSGSVAIANGATANLFTPNNLEVWLVEIRENGGNTGFGGTAMAGAIGSVANVTPLQATNGSFAVSGANLQYHNTAGSDLTYDWTAIRLM